ncbi:MAG TPA: hypothetical protein VMZ24_03845 [Patescibacteria group bacterium]|nr:hypothetical protein [Patescibacteria group bacterium]
MTLPVQPTLIAVRCLEGMADQIDEQTGSKSASAADSRPGECPIDSGARTGLKDGDLLQEQSNT